MNRTYEVVYILNPTIGEEAVNTAMERIQGMIEAAATIDEIDVWGRRRLMYEIDDQMEGHYVLIRFSSPVDFPKELERVLKISDDVLRYMVVRADD